MTTRYHRGQVVITLRSPWWGAVASWRGGRLRYARRLCCRRPAIDTLLARGGLLPGGHALGPSALDRVHRERVPNMGMGTYVSLTMGTAHADGLGLVALMERCPGWVGRSACVLTLIFLTRQVRQPVLLLVYFGRFLCWGSLRGWGATT